jgi:glycosyltransferase 2 family protein
MSRGRKGTARVLGRVLDPRILIGLAITGVTLWYSFRDISFQDLLRDMGRANLAVLILPAVPVYVLSVYIRALRWRHLVAGVATIETGPLFRATAVGFMANNIFPLRIGEVVRAWYLARESSASGTALFGTVIVERLIDAICVFSLAAVVLGSQGARAAGLDPIAVLAPLAALVAAPVLFIVSLRAAPDRVLGWAHAVARRILPEAAARRVARGVGQLAVGLGALRGGRSIAWVLVHTVVLWLVLSVIPFAAALLALGIETEGLVGLVRMSFSILVWVGAAVALPSAPGFFGPYHAACWVALRPYGVDKETAVALGTLAHAVFWVSMTTLGLAVLRFGGTRLEETLASAVEPEAQGEAWDAAIPPADAPVRPEGSGR